MPQIVPVSDFRADITSVSRHTDQGEVVVLTQNGRPRWAMVDYNEWNASAREQERAFARALLATEEREATGELESVDSHTFREHMEQRRAARHREVRKAS